MDGVDEPHSRDFCLEYGFLTGELMENRWDCYGISMVLIMFKSINEIGAKNVNWWYSFIAHRWTIGELVFSNCQDCICPQNLGQSPFQRNDPGWSSWSPATGGAYTVPLPIPLLVQESRATAESERMPVHWCMILELPQCSVWYSRQQSYSWLKRSYEWPLDCSTAIPCLRTPLLRNACKRLLSSVG